ncbi:ammonium transporter [Phytomonospora sp. NPDC050363]|uniref:ammonium transporter n=1 Tax=Phytomonospora sp. NPDC050363 TaxID=3155642 RepID=UPI0033C7DD21
MLAAEAVQPGDTAWVLTCAALVLFMTPGLALFYAGMVRTRTTLVMLQQNIIPLGVVSVLWILLGYSLAFSADLGGIVGDLELFGLQGIGDTTPAPAFHTVEEAVTIPTLAFVAYQMMFAVITPALITGATADRLKFAGWVVFVAAWSLVVYAPVAHWLWGPDGWLSNMGAQDWAGGMVVHASAGAAVIAVLLVIGRRRNWPRTGSLPHSLPITIAGAGILWFGWFGFNAGDGLQADGIAAQALLNTHIAAAGAMCVWLIAEKITDGHSTVVGAVSGAVAGLATITPCAGYVNTFAALLIGAIAGLVCNLALRLKFAFKLDDALDVLAVHFVGGVVGSVLLGLFASKAVNSFSADGLFYGGGAGLLGDQALAVLIVAAFSFCLTWLIAIAIQKTIGLRAAAENEDHLDQAQQGLDAYHLGGASDLPGTGGTEAGDTEPVGTAAVPAAAHGGRTKLVTALLDPSLVRADELQRLLLAGGATSIVVSDAHVRTSAPQPQTLRGNRQSQEFPGQLRVEVLVDEARAQAVAAALSRYSSAAANGYIQTVDPTASPDDATSAR